MINGALRWRFILIALLALLGNGIIPNSASASCSHGCVGPITGDHVDEARPQINTHTSNQFTQHRGLLVSELFTRHVLPALMLMTEQMSAVAMQQTMIIGTFFDAKHQLETQRLFQELQAQAHKDYQPSEDFCYFGTNVRSLANTEAKGRNNAYILSRRQQARHLGQVNVGGARDADIDKANRWEQFTRFFCDPQDNNWLDSQATSSGLTFACGAGPNRTEFTNADVDFTRTIENPRTLALDRIGFLAVDFKNFGINPNEQAIMALGNNLYGHDVLTRKLTESDLAQPAFQPLYLDLRSIAAKRSVAENSFNAIVGLKSAGTTRLSGSLDSAQGFQANSDTGKFLGAILLELGIPEDEVDAYIGKRPSYYAQMELLTKKIYQNPDFFANLYDKPANIKRKSVALKALELMLDRAIYESQVRQEMVTSVLLSSRLREPFRETNKELQPGQ